MSAMPSPRHDALISLFRDSPRLAVDILRDVLEVELPVTPVVRLESTTFNTRPSDDIEADLVIVLGPPQTPVHAIIVEIQQDKSKKPQQLARYAAALWLLLSCDVTVLLISPDRNVATYYAQPIDSGLTGYRLQAPDEHSPKYYEYAYSMSGPDVRRLLEEIMTSTTWPVYSPFAREHFGKGKAEGKAEGLTEGKSSEGARMVLLVLAARGLDVPDDTKARITACTDLAQLETWATRAATAHTLQDLFDDTDEMGD
ncbi:hypothetical protein AB0K16_41040 [Nonomuraea jabiensis]|uniref:hypothetical protein n=1 Tax=Nonomuraea jabiensis TaxID=882448 RepID=UPI0034454047